MMVEILKVNISVVFHGIYFACGTGGISRILL